MPTGQTIVSQSLVDLGINEPGFTPSASQSVNGLNKLNLFVDMLSGARDMIYEIADVVLPLVSQQSFIVGPTGTSAPFQIPRPVKVENAQVLITVGGKVLSFDLAPQTQPQWQSIDDKGATGTVPDKIYIDPQVPSIVISLHPIPLCIAQTQLDLGVWTAVQQFATLSTNVNLPPAYLQLLVLGLQLQLAPTYGNLVNPVILQMREQQYAEALSTVRSMNSSVQMTQLQPVNAPAPPQGSNPELAQLLQQLRANAALQRQS